MTEQERYERLDRAIEALLAGHRFVTTGDEELDAMFGVASGLRGLPDPRFQARLRAELFPRPSRRLRCALPAWVRACLGPGRFGSLRGVVVPLGAAAVIAALVLTLAIGPLADRIRPAGGTEAFGALPLPSQGGGKGGGTGGGTGVPPGLSGNISYTLAAGLDLPESAPAYSLRTAEVTADRVQRVASRLGLTKPAEAITAEEAGVIAGYRVASETVCPDDLPPPPPDLSEEDLKAYRTKHCEPARVFQMMLDGFIAFRDSTIPVTATVPGEEEARGATRAWLELTGLIGDDPYTLAVSEPPTRYPGFREVTVKPRKPANLVLDYPRLLITVTGDGRVSAASGYWAAVEDESSYALHSLEELLDDLHLLRGNFNDLQTLGLLEADPWRDASVTVESVEPAYARGAGQGGQSYLVPVYVVRGHLSQAGLAEPQPFTTWVPASGTPVLPPAQTPDPQLLELKSARDSLSIPPGARSWGWGFVEWPGLITAYFVDGEPVAVEAFYREELLQQGWEPEEPAALRTTSALDFAQESSFTSFVKGDVRVAIIAATNQKDPDRGATQLQVVVEARAGPSEQLLGSLPVYPGAAIRHSGIQTPTGLLSAYSVPDSADRVVGFYRRELPTRGWLPSEPPAVILGGAVDPSQYRVVAAFTRGEVTVVILVAPDAKNAGLNLLDVVLERQSGK